MTCAHAFMPNSHRSPERGMTEGTERGSRGQLSSHRGHRTRDAGVRGAGGEDRAESWAGGKADARGDGFRVRGEEPANTALRLGGL